MDLLAIGRVASSHGVRGLLRVKSLSGETGHFLRLKEVYVRGGAGLTSYAVQSVVPHREGVLLKLAGVESREQGDRLRGRELWVDRADAAVLKEGEYYLADLCRCRVFLKRAEVGRVVAVCDGAAADFLEIEKRDGGQLVVPFAEAFVEAVDVENTSIVLKEDFELP
jgi:16S rRNA processing protein RimM